MALQYSFMPVVRRGLARSYATPDAVAGLEARPRVQVGLTLSAALDGQPAGVVENSVGMRLYGPADVIGIDMRLIVRTEPKPNVSNFEPNYLAAIDFDPPDFPWMFTPAAANAQRLRPWLVLVVFDRDHAGVAPPAMRGGPLPRVALDAEQARSELPRLSESWMWAHAQVASDSSDAGVLATAMRQDPNRNISRLVAPRRLRPATRYIACVVPAFAAGRVIGLGQDVVPDQDGRIPLDPAWPDDLAARTDIELPVYYHWEFSTGPLGDFETLARRLTTPAKYPEGSDLNTKLLKLGTAPVLLDADRLLTDGGVKKTVLYEGALVSTALGTPDFPQAAAPDADVATRLSAIVDDPEAQNLAQGPSERVPTIAPPVYGGWHAKKHVVLPAELNAGWLADLNLDPRYRLAAGYGAEVVRLYQEEFMQSCWAQVGDVLRAQMLLNFGKLAVETGKRLMARHITQLPAERVLSVLGPARGRLGIAPQETLQGRVARTSLPDAVIDPALRRLLSAQRPALKAAVRRAQQPPIATQVKQLFASLSLASKNQSLVDPTQFVPDGILGTNVYDGLDLPSSPGAQVELEPLLGWSRTLTADQIKSHRKASARLHRVGTVPRPQPSLAATRKNGLMTETHRLQFTALAQRSDTTLDERALMTAVATADVRGTEGLLMSVKRGAAAVDVAPLMIDGRSGALQFVRGGRRGLAKVPSGALAAVKTTALKRYGTAAVFATLPPNTLPTAAGAEPVRIVSSGAGGFVGTGAAAATADMVTATVLAPIKDRATMTRLSTAFTDFNARFKDTGAKFVATDFPLAATAASTLAKVDPAKTIPARVASMLSVADSRLKLETGGDVDSLFVGRRYADLVDDRLRYLIPATFDRVMAYPQLPLPAYEPLSKKLRDAFLPGAQDIPNDFVLLLKTNPRFVESYMVGLNHEMGRELLWRGYPTDQRGTPFRQFWKRLDGQLDIEPIHRWTYWTPIGGQGAASAEQKEWLVLLIRGELLKRFPNTVIYARRKSPAGEKLGVPEEFAAGTTLQDLIRNPVFFGTLPPDITFVGFPIPPGEREAWCFVIEEQMTEPRFGFDEAGSGRAVPEVAVAKGWKDVRWSDVGVAQGAHFVLADLRKANDQVPDAVELPLTAHSAQTARALLQRPFRGYWVGADLVAKT
ncbi:hypothetical protein ACFOLC_14225 [Lysobacter cavernae]|uniref:Uncharacterized protein n=1 Tax=Lysobacter cavernae TaxID=1685901 RepID=A0ABV7RTS7_9GAMM